MLVVLLSIVWSIPYIIDYSQTLPTCLVEGALNHLLLQLHGLHPVPPGHNDLAGVQAWLAAAGDDNTAS